MTNRQLAGLIYNLSNSSVKDSSLVRTAVETVTAVRDGQNSKNDSLSKNCSAYLKRYLHLEIVKEKDIQNLIECLKDRIQTDEN